MGIIFIRDLRVQAIIGIHEHERLKAQTISIDLDMMSDTTRAAATENIRDALDYQRLSVSVEAFVAASSFQLIETLAERVAELVLRDFGVPWLRLTLHKPDALDSCGDVGVVIERGDLRSRVI